jgi:predicted transport protein
MSDIKLFRIGDEQVEELAGTSSKLERSLQRLIESNLSSFLGVNFLASEYSTGRRHGGRIDTLGIDENGCPVIIEYKRNLNENVINQGLFYLDWLLDHQGQFQLLVMKTLGEKSAENIEWSSPRLLCIAGDFTKYDVHAVQQINRNIELIRYRLYGEELLLFELVNATSAAQSPQTTTPELGTGTSSPSTKSNRSKERTFQEALEKADQALTDLYNSVCDFLLSLGDDVQQKVLKFYGAFKRIKNFACIEIYTQSRKLLVFVKVDPDSITLEEGFTRDVRNIGHYGTGELEITIASLDDLEKAKPLLLQSYEAS